MKKMNAKMGEVIALYPSENSGKVYEIRRLEPHAFMCSCPSYRFARGELGWKPPCKHMRHLLIDRDAPESVVVLKPELLS